ncbi:hypothetical protein QYF36_003690 [Acer negundo]|nr:hypothetical protein QYF36_003690 [Acer negundo]
MRQYGMSIKSPSFYEAKVPLLKQEVENTRSVMNDQEDISMFIESMDTSTYARTGKLLEVKYPTLFLTPYADPCLNLKLEDIFKLPKYEENICDGYDGE